MAVWGVPAAIALLGVAVVGWNLALGARVSALPHAGRGFRLLSGLCAFLLVPALVIGLLAPTASGARVLAPLAWLLPVVAVGTTAQALWALLAGRTSAAVAFPIVLYDLMVTWVAVMRWIEGLGAQLPASLLTPGMAVSSLGAAALGDGAFLWSAAVLVPCLVPAAAARWRLSALWRALVATGCVVVLAVVGIEAPAAFGAITAERALGARVMPERARTEFAVGLRLFGALSGVPSSLVARSDVALADSLGITALHIELHPEGATTGALDSIARSVSARRDSVVLVVTLDLARNGVPERADDAWLRARLALVVRIVQRLHPDVLLPADRVTTGARIDAAWWESYYDAVARASRRGDRQPIIALATDAEAPADSALCDWVMRGGSPVDAIALSVRAHRGTPARLEDALASMARWVSLARAVPPVWLVGVPASPAVTGEVAQQRLVRHALLWGASQSWVRGVIAGDASDVLTSTGLRTATGRARGALAEVGAALKALRDLPAPAPIATDTAAIDGRRAAPDSLLRNPP